MKLGKTGATERDCGVSGARGAHYRATTLTRGLLMTSRRTEWENGHGRTHARGAQIIAASTVRADRRPGRASTADPVTAGRSCSAPPKPEVPYQSRVLKREHQGWRIG